MAGQQNKTKKQKNKKKYLPTAKCCGLCDEKVEFTIILQKCQLFPVFLKTMKFYRQGELQRLERRKIRVHHEPTCWFHHDSSMNVQAVTNPHLLITQYLFTHMAKYCPSCSNREARLTLELQGCCCGLENMVRKWSNSANKSMFVTMNGLIKVKHSIWTECTKKKKKAVNFLISCLLRNQRTTCINRKTDMEPNETSQQLCDNLQRATIMSV